MDSTRRPQELVLFQPMFSGLTLPNCFRDVGQRSPIGLPGQFDPHLQANHRTGQPHFQLHLVPISRFRVGCNQSDSYLWVKISTSGGAASGTAANSPHWEGGKVSAFD